MAAETAEIMAAGQPKTKAASQTKKRKADEDDSTLDTPDVVETATEMASEGTAAPVVKKVASPRKKRKTAQPADTEAEAPAKNMKKETSKAAPKPRQTKRAKKPAGEPPAPLAPSSPMEVSPAVQAKIDAVKRFVATEMAHGTSLLQRDPQDSKLVTIPELDLLGVIMTLYFHYELGLAEMDASISELEEAITQRFKAPLLTAGDVDWVTVNLATPTKLETRIREKIAHHGLEAVSLLEVEMELHARRNRARAGMYQWEAEKVTQTGDLLKQLVEVGWQGTRRKVEAELMRGDGREEGRVGVCPRPAVQVA